jgi:5-methyltetrahydrofolate--homocysteine methyltransferase
VRYFSEYPLEDIRPWIDWTPFFWAWEMKGKYPAILDHPKYGPEARRLFDDARAMLDQIVTNQWLTAQAAMGIFPASTVGYDDIEIYSDESREHILAIVHTLRQQQRQKEGEPNLALADFIAPRELPRPDYLGFFAVTAGVGMEQLVARYEKAHDDYHAIMVKALADRLAEAFAELLHWRVRREFWGYAPDEQLSPEEILQEKYRGIRPAPGYPACPDHTEKTTLFELLRVSEHTDIRLTENFAMHPAASVSGYYFAHPQSRYFAVGCIGKDQVMDYARRKGMDVKTVEKWLASILGYDV